MEVSEEIQHLLKEVVDHFDKEDRSVRERQIRTWRKLKLYWEGFQNVWWSEVAHDWRVYDEQLEVGSNDQAYYDKPINVFRALLESIIAALSISVPGITCYPDDADNPLDISTAKAGNKIAELVSKHNDASLLWLRALYIWCTEGMVACYSYPKEDNSFGTYDEKEYKDEELEAHVCPMCNTQLDSTPFDHAQNPDPQQQLEESEQLDNNERDEFMPDDADILLHDALNKNQIVCANCASVLDPNLQKSKLVITRLVGITTKPKSRICMEAYGGLWVKVPNYAMKQADCPYLIFAYESHYSNVLERYKDLNKDNLKMNTSSGGMYDPYERWGRLNPQYNGEYPLNTVTVRNCWLRPSSFRILDEDSCKILQKKFPDGAKVTFVNEVYAEAENESLDDCWTLTKYPLSDFIHHDPLGMLVVNVQDITNEIISLVLQTIEHGIPQTFVDPGVLNFDAYRQMETTPGMLIPTKAPRTGQKISDGFFETRTATLSGEVLPFSEKIQEFGQFVSGALPSLFGGAMQTGKTASEYSMSRAQALQRLQNNWKVLLVWWKEIFGKVIPAFMQEMQEDEKYVQKDESNNFTNVYIRKAEIQGKIGQVEVEANENLPLTWAQKKDIIMQLMQNPEVMPALTDPENINLLKDAIGLNDFSIPGEDDRQKQYEEIGQLVQSSPMQDPMSGQMVASVPIDPDIDNHQIEAQICRHWLISDAGRLAKLENVEGYQNVLLHMKDHLMAIQQSQMQQQPQQQQQNKPPAEKPPQQPGATQS